MALLFGHEFGHAIQDRLETVDDLPTIVKENAGRLRRRRVHRLGVEPAGAALAGHAELDKVLVGYIQLRDPDPHSPSDQGTHGDGFDRLSALATGISKGVTACYASSWANRSFTERPFVNAQDYTSNGNEPEAEVLNGGTQAQGGGGLQPSLNTFWKEEAATIGKGFVDRREDRSGRAPALRAGTIQRPAVRLLPERQHDLLQPRSIADKAYAYGDYALGTMFVYGWGLAVRHQLFDGAIDTSRALLAAGVLRRRLRQGDQRRRADRTGVHALAAGHGRGDVGGADRRPGPAAFGRAARPADRIQAFVKGYSAACQVC